MSRARPTSIAILVAAALAASPSAGSADEPSPAAVNPLSTLDTTSLPGFRGRPLFAPSRRPPDPPPVAEAAPVAAPTVQAQPNLRLTGVIEGPEESVAVVQNLDANETWQLRIGDRVGGWLVTAIDPVAMRMTLDERDEEYRLFDKGR